MSNLTLAETIIEIYDDLFEANEDLNDYVMEDEDLEYPPTDHELGEALSKIFSAKRKFISSISTLLNTHPQGHKIKQEISDQLLIETIQKPTNRYNDLRKALNI